MRTFRALLARKCALASAGSYWRPTPAFTEKPPMLTLPVASSIPSAAPKSFRTSALPVHPTASGGRDSLRRGVGVEQPAQDGSVGAVSVTHPLLGEQEALEAKDEDGGVVD